MREKIATALRIAVFYGYKNLCIGSFGLGSGFRYVFVMVAWIIGSLCYWLLQNTIMVLISVPLVSGCQF